MVLRVLERLTQAVWRLPLLRTCVMKFRQDGGEAHLIGKTDVENDTLDPAWATSFAFTRAEAKSYGETATFRFEVYDRDLEGADLLGVAECTLGDLCAEGETFDDFHVNVYNHSAAACDF